MPSVSFIVNPISGGKDKSNILSLIESVIDKRRFSYEILYTEYEGHATELARFSCSEIVVAVGGDGTVNEVATGLIDSQKALGIVPCGSGDGLALHLGISRNPKTALEQLNQGKMVPMDYAQVNGKAFFCTMGLGFDAIVSSRFAQAGKRGLRTYIAEAVNSWMKFTPDHYLIEADGLYWSGPATLLTVGNINQWGNNAFICPDASVSDGLLDITIIKPIHSQEIPLMAMRLMRGTIKDSLHVISLRGSHFRVIRESRGPMHCDGEPLQLGKSLEINIIPSSLNVMVPIGSKKI